MRSHKHLYMTLHCIWPAGRKGSFLNFAGCSGRSQALAGALKAAGAEDLVLDKTPARLQACALLAPARASVLLAKKDFLVVAECFNSSGAALSS